MKNYFIIHGSFGNPFCNWIPWLYKEAQNLWGGVDQSICYVPHFPTGVGLQNYDNWEKILLSYVDSGLLGENTTIFAHSIAPIFVCKFLVKHKIKVGKLIFVCGFNNYFGINEEYDEVNKTMYFDELAKVKVCANEIVCIYSDNDPYVIYEKEKEFADSIATKQIVIEGGKHLNKEAGYDEFPLLKEFL